MINIPRGEALAELIPLTARNQYSEERQVVCMTYGELREFAQALTGQTAPQATVEQIDITNLIYKHTGLNARQFPDEYGEVFALCSDLLATPLTNKVIEQQPTLICKECGADCTHTLVAGQCSMCGVIDTAVAASKMDTSKALSVAVSALKFYADGDHFSLSDPDAWDTVSGEPQNFQCDEAGTATVEDGSLAKVALQEIAGESKAYTEMIFRSDAEEGICSKCKQPWYKHDFGVPEPFCLDGLATPPISKEVESEITKLTEELECMCRNYLALMVDHRALEVSSKADTSEAIRNSALEEALKVCETHYKMHDKAKRYQHASVATDCFKDILDLKSATPSTVKQEPTGEHACLYAADEIYCRKCCSIEEAKSFLREADQADIGKKS